MIIFDAKFYMECSNVLFHYICVFEAASRVAQDGWELFVVKNDLGLLILFSPPSRVWGYRCEHYSWFERL